MSTFMYPARVRCEPEWASQSLTTLKAHLSQRYRRPIRQRMEEVSLAFPEVWPCEGDSPNGARERLANELTLLRNTLDEHVWLEDEVLCPAIARLEDLIEPADSRTRDGLYRLVMTVDDHHIRIRKIIDQLASAVDAIEKCVSSTEEALLVADIQMVALLLIWEMNLEDRCLWPRVLDLLRLDL